MIYGVLLYQHEEEIKLSVPSKFPTEQIMLAAILAFAAYLVIFAFYANIKRERAYQKNGAKDREDMRLVVWMLLAALALRLVLSYYIVGHKTDINCFTAWGDRVATNGFKNFYAGFADYPPGYIYILGLMSKISNILGHGVYTVNGTYDAVHVALIKLPAILADLGSAYLVYKLARKKLRFDASFLVMTFIALNPVLMYVSGGWGQIDQILTVLLVCSILLLLDNKPIRGGIVYGLAILIKPQALMMGPILAIAYIFYVFDDNFFALADVEAQQRKDSRGIRMLKTAIAVVCACFLIIVTAIPFATEEMPWYQIILEKYLGTATSYEYASVNAYNLYSLVGANWKHIDEIAILGLNYGQLGTIGMVLSVGFGAVLYIVGRKKHIGSLSLAAAYTFAGLFTLGHYMHERYLVPTLLLLLVAYLLYSDRRLLWTFVAYTGSLLVNCIAAFYYSELHEYGLYWDERIVFWCSLANVIIFILFTYFVIRIMLQGKTKGDAFLDEPFELSNEQLAEKMNAQLLKKTDA